MSGPTDKKSSLWTRLKHNPTKSSDSSSQPRKPLRPNGIHVVLTGSTGSLGTYLLHELLALPNVAKVTCLNRSDSALSRQVQSSTWRGLTTSFDSSRVSFLQCDLAAPYFGLGEDKCRELAADISHIIHNAWPVDFNRHVSSFEPQIQGVKALIDFTTRCQYDVSLMFISSISVVARWGTLPSALAKVPEIPLDDWRLARMGYGQSKLISERLLAEASRVLGIHTAICRVGQVAGPVKRGEMGMWNKQEWLPSLVASSKFLGKVPRTLGPVNTIDWIPVDILGKVIVELLPLQCTPTAASVSKTSKKSNPLTAVWHIVNPRATTWGALLPAVQEYIQGSLKKDIQTIDFIDWVDALEESAAHASLEEVKENPAAKLIPYFDNLRDKARRFPKAQSATLDTQETQKGSAELSSMEPVTAEWFALWGRQWDRS